MNVRRVLSCVMASLVCGLLLWPVTLVVAGPQPSAEPVYAKAATAVLSTVVDGGFDHSCRIRTDGAITCWGFTEQGRLAHPTTGVFSAISLALNHSCALRNDGVVLCWGTNVYNVLNVPPGVLFSNVAAGLRHVCGVTTASTLTCWGTNDPGINQAVPPAGSNYVEVAAGHMTTCARRTDNSLVCWGRNTSGEDQPVPSTNFAQITMGEVHGCGVKLDQSLQCWGGDADGRLNAPSGTFTQVSAGDGHNCAIRTDQTMACWGLNDFNQAVAPSGTFLKISAGAKHNCAIRTDSTIYCWGRNDFGQAPQVTLTGTLSGIAAVGSPFSRSLGATGGYPPYIFCVSGGTLTPGLTLAENGQLTGTPTAAGTFNFSALGVDKHGIGQSLPFTITSQLQLIPTSLPGGTIGATYSQGLTAVGATPPVTFSIVAGGLPPGLSLSAAGVISGVPSGTSAIFPVTIRAVDGQGNNAERAYNLAISETGATTWYFAEGYTGTGFDQYFTIQNPNNAAADVLITYFLTGAAPVEKVISVPANSRYTVAVHEPAQGVGRNQAVSARVESRNGVGIVVERPMYFNYSGTLGSGVTGGHNVMGSTLLRTSWLFGEGYTGPGFDEYLTIMNPHVIDAPVTVTYFLDGAPPQTRQIMIPRTSRYTIHVHNPTGDGLGRNQAVSARVETSLAAGIVVERPMYFRYGPGGAITGGHNVMGTAAPKATWFFPDASTTTGFDTYLTIMNTFPTAAQLRLTYYVVGEATPRTRDYTVAASSRATVHVHNQALGGIERGKSLGIKVETLNGVDVVVERPMYFNYNGRIRANGGLNVMGATGPVRTWLFAEGYTGTGFDQYLVILNPTASPATVTITYYLTGGAPKSVPITVDPFSRRTVVVFDPTEGVGNNQAVSAKVQSTTDNIVVERPMFFRYGPSAIDGGHTVMGYAPGQ